VIVNGLNGFLLGDDQSYWSREFKRSLVKRFPGTLSRFEIDLVEDLFLPVCSPFQDRKLKTKTLTCECGRGGKQENFCLECLIVFKKKKKVLVWCFGEFASCFL
jgi:hypothetical protein